MLLLMFLIYLFGRNDDGLKIYTLHYPVQLLSPVTAKSFKVELRKNDLRCFGNIDIIEPTYKATFGCLMMIPGMNCYSIWGTRSISINTWNGSVEFFRVNSIPRESVSHSTWNEVSVIHASRWYQDDAGFNNKVSSPILATSSTAAGNKHKSRERESRESQEAFINDDERMFQTSSYPDMNRANSKTLHVPAEPLYLCGRSSNWQAAAGTGLTTSTSSSVVSVEFRHTYIRESDRRQTLKKLLLHTLFLLMFSSRFLLPYVLTCSVLLAVGTSTYGTRISTAVLPVSGCIALLTPFMFTKHNRTTAKLYVSYFLKRPWARHEREDIRSIIRDSFPVFQTLYFSSILAISGTAVGYFLYVYGDVSRDSRNRCVQGSIALSLAWSVFSVGRYLEVQCKEHFWLGMSVVLYRYLLYSHINPATRTEVGGVLVYCIYMQ